MAFALSAALASAAAAQTYYVNNQSAACSDLGAGTQAQPYCTIAAAVAAHNGPGITILVMPGTYREQVTLPSSGAAGLPFVIKATGPGVIIDGTDDFSTEGQWVNIGSAVPSGDHGLQTLDQVWLAASVTWAPKQVFVDGIRLTPSTATPDVLPVDAFTWVSGEGLYVNYEGTNPGLHQTLVGHRSYGFSMFGKSWVTVDGFEIARSEERGVNIAGGSGNVVIARNRVTLARSYGIQCNASSNVTIEENVVSNCDLHGIGLTAGSTGCIVRDNESFSNSDPLIRRANGIHLIGSPGNFLYGNRLHHNQDSGMDFKTGSNNCISWNNRSWNNGDHGYDHLGAAGIVHMHDLAFGNYKDGFSVEGNSPNTRIHNCIAVDNGLTTAEFNLWVNDSSAVGLVSDHNIFWNSTSQAPIKFIATTYMTLAAYVAASGQDTHSRQANPRFVDAATGNFILTVGSPGIDAAKSDLTSWPAADAMGAPRVDDPLVANTGVGPVLFADIGPVEYVAPTDLPPVVVCPNMIKPNVGTTVNFTVTVSDPDGQPIQSLTMVPVTMPPNSGAVFTPNATNTSGTFTWPLKSYTGTFKVKFVATNSLTTSRTTTIQVRSSGHGDAVEAIEEGAVGELAMSNGFPNPSAGDVEFSLDLPRDAQVSWAVFDLQGRMVWSEEGSMAAGHAQLRWDGMTTTRGRAATGVYLVRARVDGTTFSRRVVRF